MMKKYLNNIRTLASLLMTGAAFAACSNTDDIIEQQPVVDDEQTYTLTINATTGSDATTRALKLETNGALTAYWENGDQVTVMKENNSITSVGTLTASNANGSTATFSGKVSRQIQPNDRLTLTYHWLMGFNFFATQTGTLANASKLDVATATVTVADINDRIITIKETEASFTTQTAMIKLTLIDGIKMFNATSLKISVDGQDLLTFSLPAATYTANGNGILYFALPNADIVATVLNKTKEALAAAPVTFTVSDGDKTYTVTKQGYIFAAGKYYTSTLANLRDGALSGRFTVNSSGKIVRFSKGNLQYRASSNTWRFADHQYDYIGSDNRNISEGYSGWIDLFAWGTSGYNHGAESYQPWSIASSGYNAYGGGWNSLYDGDGTADWGYNAILNGGNTENSGWRTLKSEEWKYLFNSRSSNATVNGTKPSRYTKAEINTDQTSVKGIILFPDDYAGGTPEGVSWGDINTGFKYNTKCTTAGWTALEAAGCVFLPAAGNRSNKSCSQVGEGGYYWSSSAYTTNGTNNALHNYFTGTTSHSDIYISLGVPVSRSSGLSVRLVTE